MLVTRKPGLCFHKTMRKKTDEVVRFRKYIKKTNGCWVWTGSTNRKGYGQFPNTLIQGHQTHRLSFFLAYGYLPTDLCVLHRCDNPPCVRPEHLFLGTQADNIADKVAKGRCRNGVTVGEANNKSKLTADQVQEIRNSSRLDSVIAAELGVSRSTIHRARTARTWSHL